jgi:hypothetical protein
MDFTDLICFYFFPHSLWPKLNQLEMKNFSYVIICFSIKDKRSANIKSQQNFFFFLSIWWRFKRTWRRVENVILVVILWKGLRKILKCFSSTSSYYYFHLYPHLTLNSFVVYNKNENPSLPFFSHSFYTLKPKKQKQKH